jgi:hypothetical protein
MLHRSHFCSCEDCERDKQNAASAPSLTADMFRFDHGDLTLQRVAKAYKEARA